MINGIEDVMKVFQAEASKRFNVEGGFDLFSIIGIGTRRSFKEDGADGVDILGGDSKKGVKNWSNDDGLPEDGT
jgi:hypothetical protein